MPTWQQRLHLAFCYCAIPAFMYYAVFQYLYHYKEAPDPRYHFMTIILAPVFFRAVYWLVEPFSGFLLTVLFDYVVVGSLMAIYYNVGQPYQATAHWCVLTCAGIHVTYLFLRGWMDQDGPYSDIISLLKWRNAS